MRENGRGETMPFRPLPLIEAGKMKSQQEKRQKQAAQEALSSWQASSCRPVSGFRAANSRRKENPVLMPVFFLPLFFLGSLLQASETYAVAQKWKSICQQQDNHKLSKQQVSEEHTVPSFQAFVQEHLGIFSWESGWEPVLPASMDWEGLQQAWFALQRRCVPLRPVNHTSRSEFFPGLAMKLSSLPAAGQEDVPDFGGNTEALAAWNVGLSCPETALNLYSGIIDPFCRLQNGERACTLPAYPF